MSDHAIVIRRTGGTEVLEWEPMETPQPGPGEALIRQTAVGLNYIDTYHRTGLYPLASLPAVLGLEGAGVVEAIGSNVDEISVGQRVGYCTLAGAYRQRRIAPADRLIPLPDHIDDETAAAGLLKGMTVEYLLERTHRIEKGEKFLFHAAAGGVGAIACQWSRALGAEMIGTVGSSEKANAALRAGAAHVIDYAKEDFVQRTKEIAGGEKLGVVYDSVGKATWERSMSLVRPRGLLVLFGNASGAVPPLDPGMLSAAGSIFLTRPTLFHYTSSREELLASAGRLFAMIESGAVKIEIGQRYPLADAARAHADLEARKTQRSTILVP